MAFSIWFKLSDRKFLGLMIISFKNYENVILKGQYSNSSTTETAKMAKRALRLNVLADSFIHRRDESFLSNNIPSKHEYAFYIRPTELQRKLYKVNNF